MLVCWKSYFLISLNLERNSLWPGFNRVPRYVSYNNVNTQSKFVELVHGFRQPKECRWREIWAYLLAYSLFEADHTPKSFFVAAIFSRWVIAVCHNFGNLNKVRYSTINWQQSQVISLDNLSLVYDQALPLSLAPVENRERRKRSWVLAIASRRWRETFYCRWTKTSLNVTSCLWPVQISSKFV